MDDLRQRIQHHVRQNDSLLNSQIEVEEETITIHGPIWKWNWVSKLRDGLLPALVMLLLIVVPSLLMLPIQKRFGRPGLLVYMLVYQLDELVIFGVAVVTLKSSRLEEKHGRGLKLIGGMLLLTLALVMIINPALMNNLSTSLWIFVAAFGAAGLVLLVHRVILPDMGIHIGTEKRGKSKTKRKTSHKA